MLGQDSVVSLMTGDIPALLFNDETREFVVNPFKSSAKWSWQPGRFENQFPYTLGANRQVDFNVKVTPEDGMKGDVEVCAFLLTSTGRISVQPFIPILNKFISNVPLSASLMFGTAQLPGLLAQTIYSFPSVDWTLAIRDLTGSSNVISPVLFGRRFTDRQKERIFDPRQAQILSKFMHAYWLGPTSGTVVTSAGVVSTVQGGAEVSVPAGATCTLYYQVPGDAVFDCKSILDDSTSTTGLEPDITGQIFPGDNADPLNDSPMQWRDFLASPTTLAITGMPSDGFLRAASLPSPGGCWTNMFERSTKIKVVFVSADAGTITLRTGFHGTLIYAPEAVLSQLGTQAGAVQNQMVR